MPGAAVIARPRPGHASAPGKPGHHLAGLPYAGTLAACQAGQRPGACGPPPCGRAPATGSASPCHLLSVGGELVHDGGDRVVTLRDMPIVTFMPPRRTARALVWPVFGFSASCAVLDGPEVEVASSAGSSGIAGNPISRTVRRTRSGWSGPPTTGGWGGASFDALVSRCGHPVVVKVDGRQTSSGRRLGARCAGVTQIRHGRHAKEGSLK